ncbi:PREDICTED: uncharacterized protein LOC104780890 isoform X1 [Camelina sativa]|uniref:Uncharacterized protein LOC104780890 isoform X1 n=1 Tax=Camelina sativa TaxID=90675 RepID=A0ABM1RML2_CAMSA|nr:PREDICTED: uncharacterized protein LOC104780890 isoform X1 [Camelina sativa]
MNGYRLKDPTPLGREFLVEKFNKEFNLNTNYRFFKEKIDQLKRKYKKYKQLLQGSTGITVDPVTSVISASDSWWKDREVCKIVKSFKRKPPEFWDVMQRCFILHDVQSQSLYFVHQKREELMNEGIDNYESQVPETKENEEVYRVNINDETRPSNEFTQDHLQHNSSHAPPIHTPASRVQQQGGLRRGSSSQRGAGSSRISIGSGSRGSRRKQSFEATLTDTMNGFREFQRQSLQQLRPNFFDQDDYEEFDNAVKIFESLELPSDTDFYWACIHAFKEERFWRKYFIDRAERTTEDKLRFLQALTGYTRDSEFVGKRLVSGQNGGSPNLSNFTFGSPSGSNNSWGQNSGGQ